MRGDEVLPRRSLTPFRSRRDPMPAQNIADRLVGDVMTEIGERSGDPVVAPAGVLTPHLHNQAFYLRVNLRPPRVGPVLRAIELLRDQLAEPAEDSLRLCDLGDFRQTLSAESLPDLGQSGAFRIREPKRSEERRV